MSTNAYRKCPKCGKTAIEDDSVRFHKFPKPGTTNILRATAWASYCWPDDDWTSIESLTTLYRKGKVLCGRHFQDTCYTDSGKRHLKIYSVPRTPEYVKGLLESLQSKIPTIVQQIICSKDATTPEIVPPALEEAATPVVVTTASQEATASVVIRSTPQELTTPVAIPLDSQNESNSHILMELIEKIIQLEAHNMQLKNIISKNLSKDSKYEINDRKKPFDFNKSNYRRILLRILYFGWNYQGLAVQEDTNQTIEYHLFHALTKSCLIQSRELSQYHRCGRTDKGVSSFGQVISIMLRSRHSPENQHTVDSIQTEMPYCKILNRLLPKEIRVVAWMPIPVDKPEYSARFDCKKRQYKYYFPRSSLDLTAMQAACQRLVGSHDYRHLCKMDVGNGVTEFRREIMKADIIALDERYKEEPTSMYYLLIEGNAFLWHQIRCIMGVLFLIGEGKETPDVITDLLDVDKNPRRPQYSMALDIPLNLFHCTYDLEETNAWVYDKSELKTVISQLQGEWTIHSVKTSMIRDSLKQLETHYSKICDAETANTTCPQSDKDPVLSYTDCLIQGVKPKLYTPLMKRETCSSLEERIEHYKKKRKIYTENETE